MYTVQTLPGEFKPNKITENYLLQSGEFKSNNMYENLPVELLKIISCKVVKLSQIIFMENLPVEDKFNKSWWKIDGYENDGFWHEFPPIRSYLKHLKIIQRY